MSIQDEINALRAEIALHDRKYYELDAPAISDFEYDGLMRRLLELEEQYPEYGSPDSPSMRVGGAPLDRFTAVTHEVPLESLNNVFSHEELIAFGERVSQAVGQAEFIVEPKVDGISVSLEYEGGQFIRGATRGDGVLGEDVTENLRTVRTLPLILAGAPSRLIVRGEVYMSKAVFEELNREREDSGKALLANPRNAAAGSIRQLNPKIASERRLDLIVFNVQLVQGADFVTHAETLDALNGYGFRVVPYTLCGRIEDCPGRIEAMSQERMGFPYEIDGAVVKVNNLRQRMEMGSTSRAPRWAAAYKYPPEKKESRVLDIVVNVGRTGVLTPKAVIESVRLAGTTVTNATLHNLDNIEKLDLRIGDSVIVQKAGEIIPQVVEVLHSKRPGNSEPFVFPEKCPECGAVVERDLDGVALRCTGIECPAQLVRNIAHFASKEAMDIDGLGIAIVEMLIGRELIKSPAELYYLSRGELIEKGSRIGEKSADNLIASIEASRNRGLARLLCAFGIRQVGQKAAKALASKYGSIDELMEATEEELTEICDIGPVTAGYVTKWLASAQSRHQIELLREASVRLTADAAVSDNRFAGMKFVLTGALERLTRDEAAEIIERYGGSVSASVSGKTEYLVAGENTGSKYVKAQALGIKILTEQEFMEMLS